MVAPQVVVADVVALQVDVAVPEAVEVAVAELQKSKAAL